MKHLGWIFLAFFLFLGFEACEEKDDEIPEGAHLETFSKLVAERDSVQLGDSTKITAQYEGQNITQECIHWRTNSNAPVNHIEGSPHQVYFWADPCVGVAESKIYCEIKAQNKRIEKSITIYTFR